MKKWEYWITTAGPDDRQTEVLNKMGQSGWELVAVTKSSLGMAHVFIFKREITAESKWKPHNQ